MRRSFAVLALVLGGACTSAAPNATDQAGRIVEPETSTTTAAPATTTTTTMPPRIGDEFTNGNNHAVKVHSLVEFAVDPNTTSLVPDAGQRYMAADVQGCAGPGGMQMNPAAFDVEMADHTRRDSTYALKEPALGLIALPEGQCARGWVTFEVPVGQRPSFIHFSYGGIGTARWQV